MRKLFVILLMGVSFLSAKAQFVEGKHYEVVSDKLTNEPVVTEFFSLFCGHCYQFEMELIEPYLKGIKAGTKFEKSHVDWIPRNNEPVSFGIAKAFLVMEALKVDKKLIPTFFDLIHAQRKPMEKEEQIKAVFIENGVNESDFDKHYNDPKLVEKTKQMIALYKERNIVTVPTVVVNGKYKINITSLSGMDDLIKLTNMLLEKK